MALLRRVDHKVAALLDEAEAPSKLSNDADAICAAVGSCQSNGKCKRSALSVTWWRHGMQVDDEAVFENRSSLHRRRVIVCRHNIHSCALDVLPVDPASAETSAQSRNAQLQAIKAHQFSLFRLYSCAASAIFDVCERRLPSCDRSGGSSSSQQAYWAALIKPLR